MRKTRGDKGEMRHAQKKIEADKDEDRGHEVRLVSIWMRWS